MAEDAGAARDAWHVQSDGIPRSPGKKVVPLLLPSHLQCFLSFLSALYKYSVPLVAQHVLEANAVIIPLGPSLPRSLSSSQEPLQIVASLSGHNWFRCSRMPRCAECSNIVLYKQTWGCESDELRTWSSGPDLIKFADSGCDLCSFVRKHVESVAETNRRRMNGKSKIVLQDCSSEITLSWGSRKLSLYISAHGYQRCFELESGNSKESKSHHIYQDPILHACKLFKSCMSPANNSHKFNHKFCQSSLSDLAIEADSLPRRLLDLSHGDEIVTLDVQTWIHTNRATLEELSRYCTLSYRWGEGLAECSLSTPCIAERMLSFASMPQTFQDAITVARKLDIRFIWIDALCIIQPGADGDSADWEAEGPRMWLVYQNSICTIAATCSSNPHDGFLSTVGSGYIPSCSIQKEKQDGTIESYHVLSTQLSFESSVVTSNLNRRGWVAQERLLSRRLLHFTEEGIFWECLSNSAVLVNPLYASTQKERHHAYLMTFREWLSFIEFYSGSFFTKYTDRLIALSSIAKAVPLENFGEQYFAGIWGAHILHCLSWRSIDACLAITRAPYLAIAPSWSWASVPGRIKYGSCGRQKLLYRVAELEGISSLAAQTTKPYANPKRDVLKLRARPFSTSLLKLIRTGMASVTWDELQNHSTMDMMYTVVPLMMEDGSKHASCRFDALVVTSVSVADDESFCSSCVVYRRIGYMEGICHVDEFKREERHAPVSERKTTTAVDPKTWFKHFFPEATQQTIVIV